MTQPFIGQITMFGGNFAPSGWAFCNGQILAIDQNTALFSLLGTTYGGDGTSTFALPDLQCRLPVHQGRGPNLSTYVLGQIAGTENVILVTNQMPAHSHTFSVTASTATSPTLGSTLLPAKPTTGQLPSFYTVPTGGQAPNIKNLAAAACGSSGSNLPHSNQMPSLGITFIIALVGIFPSRN